MRFSRRLVHNPGDAEIAPLRNGYYLSQSFITAKEFFSSFFIQHNAVGFVERVMRIAGLQGKPKNIKEIRIGESGIITLRVDLPH
jgi:hypothetical protein